MAHLKKMILTRIPIYARLQAGAQWYLTNCLPTRTELKRNDFCGLIFKCPSLPWMNLEIMTIVQENLNFYNH